MWYGFFYPLVAPAVAFFAGAADMPITPITPAFSTPALVSSHLLATNFSTDPRLAQIQLPAPVPGRPAGQLEVRIINYKQCVNTGFHLTYRLVVRNRGVIPLFDVTTQNQYPVGSTFITGDRPPDEHDVARHLLIWREGFLAPGQFVSYTFTVRVDGGGGAMVNNVIVTAQDALGGLVQAASDHRIPVGCVPPVLAPGAGQSTKEPAIICDPAEVGCRQILPNLGVNFERAQNPAAQVRICAPNDPRGCVPNRPELGVRFAEAIADIIPGDCRVLPDNIISTPDYQDALNRRSEPSAFYLAPLYDAGQNFRQLVLENAILGIAHFQSAEERLQNLQEAGEIASVLQRLEGEYQDLQAERKKKFDPVAQRAINQAIESIRRSCGGDQANNIAVLNLRRALEAVKEAYEANLDERATAYRNMLQVFLRQTPWKDRQAFDELFTRTFTAHQQLDEALDHEIRLQWWEVALDGPKAEATACEAENLFAADVERTWCESNNYAPPRDLLAAPNRILTRAKVGQVAPPANQQALTNQGPQAVLQEALISGVSCGGNPGDPWWAADCSCNCNQVVGDSTGRIKPCVDKSGNIKPITRHDNRVQDPTGDEDLSRAECIADGQKHADPFF